MTQADFETFARVVLDEALALLGNKGKDYAKIDNAFKNFEGNAEHAGTTREQALAVLLSKHLPAFFRRLRGEELASESFRSRGIDIINYVIFAMAMVDSNEFDNVPAWPDDRPPSLNSLVGRTQDQLANIPF